MTNFKASFRCSCAGFSCNADIYNVANNDNPVKRTPFLPAYWDFLRVYHDNTTVFLSI